MLMIIMTFVGVGVGDVPRYKTFFLFGYFGFKLWFACGFKVG